MKRLSLVLALTAVVCLIGASLVAFPGCTQRKPEPASPAEQALAVSAAGTTTETQKRVEIGYDTTAKVITASPSRVVISKGAKQEVVWRCPIGDVEILFKGAPVPSPFESDTFRLSMGGGALSGLVRSNADTTVYKYSVRLTVKRPSPSQQPAPLDPEVQVDP